MGNHYYIRAGAWVHDLSVFTGVKKYKPRPTMVSAGTVVSVRLKKSLPARTISGLLAGLLALLPACTQQEEPSPSTIEQETAASNPTTTLAASAPSKIVPPAQPYLAFDAPVLRRTEEPTLPNETFEDGRIVIEMGEFRATFGGDGVLSDAIVVSGAEAETALALRPLGSELNLLETVDDVTPVAGDHGVGLSGRNEWVTYDLLLETFAYNPGLLHYEVAIEPHAQLPSGTVELEWKFVNPDTGEEVAANMEFFAERASFAAPIFYAYSETLDATLLYWFDLTRINPFIDVTRYGPAGTAGHRGRTFGHTLTSTDLRKLPTGESVALYDAYLFLTPGRPADEGAMFEDFLLQVSDIYDLIAKPEISLPDWQALAQETLTDLDDPDTWVELNGKRYWRAYVSDTRQSAEAITQLDVGLGAARYAARYGDEQATRIAELAEATLEDFYNPLFGLVQNSGPIAVTGSQGRGDTWYELGHVLKMAEWGLLGSEVAADIALRSADAWMEYAHAVDYRFHRFYNFPDPDNPAAAWQGSEREPDASGGYAYYMLLLLELTGEERFLEEAKAAVEALAGHGFLLAYETHITAQAAAACARLWQITGDPHYLALSYGPVANLVRLAWVWEVDHGPAAEATTFWGLNPTQRSGVITPKEQYEAWIYLDEYLRLVRGAVDPSVEKLVAEFLKYTLVTLAYTLPPLAPEGMATEHPAAYATVAENRLDLYIPLEDMRDSWGTWGAIGQQVYGAGMAPTLAALAYREINGVTVYSGYPAVLTEDNTAVITGIPPYETPVQLFGATLETFTTTSCGQAFCATVPGGATLSFAPN